MTNKKCSNTTNLNLLNATSIFRFIEVLVRPDTPSFHPTRGSGNQGRTTGMANVEEDDSR